MTLRISYIFIIALVILLPITVQGQLSINGNAQERIELCLGETFLLTTVVSGGTAPYAYTLTGDVEFITDTVNDFSFSITRPFDALEQKDYQITLTVYDNIGQSVQQVWNLHWKAVEKFESIFANTSMRLRTNQLRVDDPRFQLPSQQFFYSGDGIEYEGDTPYFNPQKAGVGKTFVYLEPVGSTCPEASSYEVHVAHKTEVFEDCAQSLIGLAPISEDGVPPYTYQWSGDTLETLNSEARAVTGYPGDTISVYCTVTDNVGVERYISWDIVAIVDNPADLSALPDSVYRDDPVMVLPDQPGFGYVGPNVTEDNGTYLFSPADVTTEFDVIYAFNTDDQYCDYAGYKIIKMLDRNSVLTINDEETEYLFLCGETSSLSVNLTGGTYPFTYQWQGLTSDMQKLTDSTVEVKHVRALLDKHDVLCTVTDSDGNTVVKTFNITAYPDISTDRSAIPENMDIKDEPIEIHLGQEHIDYNATGNGIVQNETSYFDPKIAGVGTHTISVTANYDNCSKDFSFDITVSDDCTLQIELAHATIYEGEEHTFAPIITGESTSGIWGPQFDWSNGGIHSTIIVSEAGVYGLTYQDKNGCQATDSATLTVLPLPCNLLIKIDSVFDNENVIGYTVSTSNSDDQYTYLWNSGETSFDISPTQSGKYIVTVTNENECSQTDSVIFTQQTVCEMNVEIVTYLIDIPDSLLIGASVKNGTSGFTYQWNTGSEDDKIRIPEQESGTYIVTVTDSEGCQDSDTLEYIFTKPECKISVSISGNSIISGEPVTLVAEVSNAIGIPSYIWNTQDVSGTISVSQAGTYSVTVTDENGCSTSDEVEFSETIECNLNISLEDAEIELGSSHTFTPLVLGNTGTEQPFFTEWSTGEIAQALIVSEAGKYSVTVTDGNDCKDSATATLTVIIPSDYYTISGLVYSPDQYIISCGKVITYRVVDGTFLIVDTTVIGEDGVYETEYLPKAEYTLQAFDCDNVYNEAFFVNAVDSEDARTIQLLGNATSVDITLQLKTNIRILNQNRINIYPNPMNEVATIQLPLAGAVDVLFTDAIGHVIQSYTGVQGEFNIERNALASGVYTVTIINGSAILARALLVVE